MRLDSIIAGLRGAAIGCGVMLLLALALSAATPVQRSIKSHPRPALVVRVPDAGAPALVSVHGDLAGFLDAPGDETGLVVAWDATATTSTRAGLRETRHGIYLVHCSYNGEPLSRAQSVPHDMIAAAEAAYRSFAIEQGIRPGDLPPDAEPISAAAWEDRVDFVRSTATPPLIRTFGLPALLGLIGAAAGAVCGLVLHRRSVTGHPAC